MGLFDKKTTKTVTFFFSSGLSKSLEVDEHMRDFIKEAAMEARIKALVTLLRRAYDPSSFYICWWNVCYVEIEE
jgi:hypothetical protein